MATAHERYRNNVKAGIFVSVAVALALTVIATLKDVWTQVFVDRSVYAVTFSVESGIQSLREGSPVRVGGIDMGQVLRVAPLDLLEESEFALAARDDGDRDPFNTIVVVFEINDEVPLYSNAVATVRGALIGAEAWIAISNVGSGMDRDNDGQADGRRLAPDALADRSNWLKGREAGTVLASFIGPDSAERTEEIIDNVAVLTGDARRDWESHITPMLANADASVEDIRKFVDHLNTDWVRWAATVDKVLDNALSASETIDLAMSDGRALIDDAHTGVKRINEMVEENRPSVDEFIANINAASADVRTVANRIAESTIDKVEAILDRGQQGIDAFSETARKIELEFDTLAPDLRDTVANVQLASNELALATAEIRSAPWRLLYRPSAEELEYENLYYAATKFSLAAAQLKTATQAIDRAIANHREYLGTHPEKLEQLQAMLTESMENYERAQNELLSILRGPAAP